MTGELRVIAFAGTRLIMKVEGDTLRFPQFDELEAAIGGDMLSAVGLPAAEGGLTSESVISLPENLELPGNFRIDGLRGGRPGSPDHRVAQNAPILLAMRHRNRA
jgi:hypothetical protein